MDKPSNIDLTTTGASVSTIPTATPIASEIISDFEPDPKFEITPLEKATFDCNDLFLQDNNSSELVMDPENGERNGNETQDTEKPLVSQEIESNQAQRVDSKAVEDFDSQEQANSEAETLKKPTTGSDPPASNERVVSLSTDISNKYNDCKSSPVKHESGTDHLSATISIEESIAASALVQVAESQAIRQDAEETQQHTKEPDNDRQQQFSAMETTRHVDQAQVDERSEHASYLFSLSQTSVDAQMEKVIENIVELGEGHEFPHSLGQVEDREKLLESIHREMTSVQSSIDLIADVASKQQSIEIQPNDNHKSNESSKKQDDRTNQTQDQSMDLEARATSETNGENSATQEAKEGADTTAKMSPVRMDTDNADAPELIISEGVDASEIEQIVTTEFTESPVEPIVEERTGPLKESVPNQQEADKIGLPEAVVQSIEVSGTNESSLQQPLLPEVSSGEELSKPDEKISDSHVQVAALANAPTVAIDEAVEVSSVEVPNAETESKKSPSPTDTIRRKSGRKPKEVKKMIEDLSFEESRRSSRRVSSRKSPIEVQTLIEDNVCPAAVEKKEENSDHVSNISAAEQDSVFKQREEKEEEKTNAEEEKVQLDSQPNDIEQTNKSIGGETEKLDDPESGEGPVGRPSRSLRVRAPKRTLEEDSPKVEPPKKQIKRSRGSQDLNKSVGPTKSTTTIKLPTLKSRMTISTSDPSTRPGAHKERDTVPLTTDKKYICHHCGFATDRVNNMVYHSTKSFCKGKSELAEMMKNDIIKQQQAKSKRRQLR